MIETQTQRRLSTVWLGGILLLVLVLHAGAAKAYFVEGALLGQTSGRLTTPITVDGYLDEWQLEGGFPPSVADRANSDWIPGISGVSYWIEDGVGCKGYVGPGYGGQDFDQEAAYAACTPGHLYLALVTGTNSTGEGREDPGDVFLDLDRDGNYDLGVATTDHRWIDAGKVYGPRPSYVNGRWWKYPDIPSSAPSQVHPYRSMELYDLGASFAYRNDMRGYCDPDAYDHNVIEFYLPFADMGIRHGPQIDIHWTGTCGNDLTFFTLDCGELGNPPEVIPEPGTLALGAIALGAIGLRYRRGRRSRA